jgi:hypothetical protein
VDVRQNDEIAHVLTAKQKRVGKRSQTRVRDDGWPMKIDARKDRIGKDVSIVPHHLQLFSVDNEHMQEQTKTDKKRHTSNRSSRSKIAINCSGESVSGAKPRAINESMDAAFCGSHPESNRGFMTCVTGVNTLLQKTTTRIDSLPPLLT